MHFHETLQEESSSGYLDKYTPPFFGILLQSKDMALFQDLAAQITRLNLPTKIEALEQFSSFSVHF